MNKTEPHTTNYTMIGGERVKRCIYQIKNNTFHVLSLKSTSAAVPIKTVYKGETIKIFANEIVENEYGQTRPMRVMGITVSLEPLYQPITFQTVIQHYNFSGREIIYEFLRDRKIPNHNLEGESLELGQINEPFIFLGNRNDGYMMDINMYSVPYELDFYDYKLQINNSSNPTNGDLFRETFLNRIKVPDHFFYKDWREGDLLDERVDESWFTRPLFD